MLPVSACVQHGRARCSNTVAPAAPILPPPSGIPGITRQQVLDFLAFLGVIVNEDAWAVYPTHTTTRILRGPWNRLLVLHYTSGTLLFQGPPSISNAAANAFTQWMFADGGALVPPPPPPPLPPAPDRDTPPHGYGMGAVAYITSRAMLGARRCFGSAFSSDVTGDGPVITRSRSGGVANPHSDSEGNPDGSADDRAPPQHRAPHPRPHARVYSPSVATWPLHQGIHLPSSSRPETRWIMRSWHSHRMT